MTKDNVQPDLDFFADLRTACGDSKIGTDPDAASTKSQQKEQKRRCSHVSSHSRAKVSAQKTLTFHEFVLCPLWSRSAGGLWTYQFPLGRTFDFWASPENKMLSFLHRFEQQIQEGSRWMFRHLGSLLLDDLSSAFPLFLEGVPPGVLAPVLGVPRRDRFPSIRLSVENHHRAEKQQ